MNKGIQYTIIKKEMLRNNNNMKKYFTSLAISETQIKTTVRQGVLHL